MAVPMRGKINGHTGTWIPDAPPPPPPPSPGGGGLSTGQFCYCLTIIAIISLSAEVGTSSKSLSNCLSDASNDDADSCKQTKIRLIVCSVFLGLFGLGCLLGTCAYIFSIKSKRDYESLN